MKTPRELKAMGRVVKQGVLRSAARVLTVDQCVPTDRAETGPPVQAQKKRILFMDVACAGDPNVMEREREKRRKYRELAADAVK